LNSLAQIFQYNGAIGASEFLHCTSGNFHTALATARAALALAKGAQKPLRSTAFTLHKSRRNPAVSA
jgi:hypothetical protein